MFTWDFTQQSPGALVLPTGLTFARASSGHTVQTGTSTIVTSGITSNDIGRIGRLATAHSYGLFIEPSRTNVVTQSRTPQSLAVGSWASTTTGQSDAAGGTSAVRVTTTSGGTGRYQAPATLRTGAYTASQWVRQGAGSGSYQLVQGNATVAAVGGTAPVAWTRTECLYTFAASAAAFLPGDGRNFASSGGVAAGARDFVLDFMQHEAGKYPTSAIVTSGSEATRAAERLTIGATQAVQAAFKGRLGFYVRFRAIAALTEMDATTEGQILFGVGTTCSVWISAASRYIIIEDATGSKYSQTANSVITWARGDLVEMVMELGNGVSNFRWRINGGSVNTASFTARNDSLDPIVPSSGLDVLCAGTSWQTPAVLEQATLFVPGRGLF